MPCHGEENLGNLQGTVPVRVEMVPNTSHRDTRKHSSSKAGDAHCTPAENAVPTCHILGFEPPSGLRDELGFILGVTLEGRQETLSKRPIPLPLGSAYLHLGASPRPPLRLHPELRGFRVPAGGGQRCGALSFSPRPWSRAQT